MIARLLSFAADVALRFVAPSTCAACDAPIGDAVVFCVACAATIERAPVGDVRATFAFGGALAQAIRRMKYGSRADLATPLASLVELPRSDVNRPCVVVPVPSHPARVRSRGFDPVTSMARTIARRLDAPLDLTSLARIRDTPPLEGLGFTARRHAVRDAFALARAPRSATVLLFDDVTTTGATLAAAARPLREAGITVRPFALARAGPSTP